MDGNSSESSQEWEEHIYWDHVNPKGKLFYRVMLDEDDFTNTMKIPKKFTNHMSGELSDIVDLKDPLGFIWKAELVKTMDEAYLQSGWKDFAKAHHLEDGDLLIFKYLGNSCFKVKILDTGGCEKAHSYSPEIKNALKRKIGEVSTEIVNAAPNKKATVIGSSTNSQDDIPPTQNISRYRKEANKNQSIGSRWSMRRINEFSKNMVGETGKSVAARKDAKHHKKQDYAGIDPPICISRHTYLTVTQEGELKKLAHTVSPGNPFFGAVMCRTNVKGTFLTVPSGFTRHLPAKNCSIWLRVPGRRGNWRASYSGGKGHSRFTTNWKRFVLDNSFREGDVCLFELVKSHREKIVMEVKIWHAETRTVFWRNQTVLSEENSK